MARCLFMICTCATAPNEIFTEYAEQTRAQFSYWSDRSAIALLFASAVTCCLPFTFLDFLSDVNLGPSLSAHSHKKHGIGRCQAVH